MPPIPLPDPELRDDVVRLRPPHAGDVEAIHAACQDPLIQHYTFVPVPYEREHARTWVDSAAALRAGGRHPLAGMTRAGDDALLGTVGLLRPDWQHRVAEIGYWTAPPRAARASPRTRCGCSRGGPSRPSAWRG